MKINHLNLYFNNNIKNSPKYNCSNLAPLKRDTVSFSGIQNSEAKDSKQNNTGWVVIPSKKNDRYNFYANVEKLMTLVKLGREDFAESYLDNGDFHIYIENDEPKFCVSFKDNEINELFSTESTSTDTYEELPPKYVDVLKEHINTGDYKLNEYAKNSLERAEKKNVIIEKTRNEIDVDFNQKLSIDDRIKIFNYFGIETEKTEDNKLIISHFNQPEVRFKDIGIDETDLLKDVIEIKGDANFAWSKATDLSSLQTIGGNANFAASFVNDLSSLKTVGGNFKSNNAELPSLETIGGWADFWQSKINELPSLQTIGGWATFAFSTIKSLPSLQTIGGNANFYRTWWIEDLSSLQTIGGNANFEGSDTKSLPSLQTIGGDAHFVNSYIKDLSSLQTIGGNANFDATYTQESAPTKQINLSSLKTINGDANFKHCNIGNLSLLESIGGNITIDNETNITDLSSLKSIDGEDVNPNEILTNLYQKINYLNS